jgi:flagellar assembly protein FliH
MLIKSKQVDIVDLKKAKPVHFVRSRFEDGNENGKGNGNGNGNRQSEAAILKSDYEQKLKAAGREAYEKGFSEGLKQGIEIESGKVQSALKSLASAMGEFEQSKRDFITASERDLLNLVIAAAECVIHREVTVNKDAVCSVLNAAMKKILDRDGIRIRLNPEDYRYLTEENPGTVDPECLRKSALVQDETISRGGAVIETLFGEVDARFETQLNELKQALALKEV